MKKIIFYFSGTGNSLSVAKAISKGLGETQIVLVNEHLLNSNAFRIDDYTHIGFVFPVYSHHIPTIFSRFLESLQLGHSQYIYGVATYAAVLGRAMEQLRNSIAKQGGILSAEFKIKLPGNCISEYSAFSEVVQSRMLQKQPHDIEQIVDIVEQNGKTKPLRTSLFTRMVTGAALKRVRSYPAKSKNFYANEKCTHCGLCERLCPAQNITLLQGTPKWDIHCEHCMACIQWCPSHAIQYGDKTAKRTRYHHPQIAVADMLKAIKGE